MLHESEVLQMFKREQENHNRQLDDLHRKLENELASVQQHFEKVLHKLKTTEEELERNLKKVEGSVLNKVSKGMDAANQNKGGWKFPFFFLLLCVVGVAGFFYRLYRNATKTHMF